MLNPPLVSYLTAVAVDSTFPTLI